MADATADWSLVLSAMTDAYGEGDHGRAEELLVSALDLGAPWDLVTTTAAQAMTVRRSTAEARRTEAIPA